MDDRDELARQVMQRIEDWLDQRLGTCALRSAQAADAVVAEMECGDGTTHERRAERELRQSRNGNGGTDAT